MRAYLAMAAGASVVPLVFLGTRLTGRLQQLPAAGEGVRCVMTFGAAMQSSGTRGRGGSPTTHALSARIREALLATLAEAVSRPPA